ncbi:hypothetical protein HII36_42765 [Nonomuraea sp. NN258]|uniref:DUF6745 domain-containing protein n=1 Tax=Nonomuraea antri TaxID=2730852 RepID=UPI00156996FB|nr:hypothetical protein [Nonomuraea antri]NRQ38505.1 hypothetical protein [Nonomuraea antri]
MSALVQREAATIREEWLGHALSTRPADRPAAEAAITRLYRLVGLAPPRFHWVSSPLVALETMPAGVRAGASERVDRVGEWPVVRALVAERTRLCLELETRVGATRHGFGNIVQHLVGIALTRSERAVFQVPLRLAHGADYRHASPWYDALSPSWIARYDALRRAAGVPFAQDEVRRLGLWADAARACGWWWPRQDVCVVAERPVELRTEAADDDVGVRLHCPDGPAVRYADGWDVHAWHGTRVPAWVITGPDDVSRIERETNVEVRRCAIERIGWATYIDRAGLRLVSTARDPGNPGSELRLYDLRGQTRVLLAVNGSVERDGRRRRYGLTVPGYFDDPVAAAGWTYGLTGEEYSRLARRT